MTPEAIPIVQYVLVVASGADPRESDNEHYLLGLQHRYHRRFGPDVTSTVIKLVVHTRSTAGSSPEDRRSLTVEPKLYVWPEDH